MILIDVGVLAAALYLSYLIRFEFSLTAEWTRRLLIQLPGVLLLQLAALYLSGVFTFVWRYVGIHELASFGRAALLSAIPLLALRLVLSDAYLDWRMPLSVILIDTILAFGTVAGARVLRRAFYEATERQRRQRHGDGTGREPVLFVGAGRAGALAAREIEGRGDADIKPLGFVDDDPLKRGMTIRGLKVMGTTEDLPRLARELSVQQVIVTIAEAPPQVLQRIVAICRRDGLAVRTIPALHEVLQGRVAISRFRDVRVEDLLLREPVHLDDQELRAFLAGRRVIVTGAGGSIGRELARQIARFGPERLILLERAESALFDAHRELAELWPTVPITPVVGDVCNRWQVARTLSTLRPEVIFHAAAHKHVPLMEENSAEAVHNNVFGTLTLGQEAIAFGVGVFVLVSTDKAVRPSSIMGASKRLAEIVCQDLAVRGRGRFMAVRFGNVLGSTGSVVPIFREQIARGGPVEVTHPEMQRYFMTMPEAAQLVLQAATVGEGGDILMLDMGDPVRIADLAERMIALSGFEPGKDVEIVFTGIRPGEKLFEELELEGEEHAPTRHPKIFRGRLQPYPTQVVETALRNLEELVEHGDDNGVRKLLQQILPEAQLQVDLPGREGMRPPPGTCAESSQTSEAAPPMRSVR
jgi:FlaA1/EpsC-like NDP-sugar epimerase